MPVAHVLTTWTWDPVLGAPLLLGGALYALGLARLWHRAGTGRGIARREAAAFGAAWVTLVLALLSPVAVLADGRFSAHMTQHELLVLVAAPLLALGRTGLAWLWTLPASWRRIVAVGHGWGRPLSVVTSPAVAFLLHAAALWAWHLPSLYEAAVLDGRVHAVQHLTFTLTACAFWWGIAHGRYGRAGYGAAFLYVFATALHTGGLGALFTFAAVPAYPLYAARGRAIGVDALADQQLAGVIMWVPAGVLLTLIALGFFMAWLGEADRRRNGISPSAARGARTPGPPPRRTRRPSPSLNAARLVLTIVAAGALVAGCDAMRIDEDIARDVGGDWRRGRTAMTTYGCGTCHTVPGVPGARGLVGPPLDGFRDRVYVAGRLTNTPEHLIRWLQHPREIDPHTAMPDTGVTADAARDIVAYLYALRR
jgi:putative membrane protein